MRKLQKTMSFISAGFALFILATCPANAAIYLKEVNYIESPGFFNCDGIVGTSVNLKLKETFKVQLTESNSIGEFYYFTSKLSGTATDNSNGEYNFSSYAKQSGKLSNNIVTFKIKQVVLLTGKGSLSNFKLNATESITIHVNGDISRTLESLTCTQN